MRWSWVTEPVAQRCCSSPERALSTLELWCPNSPSVSEICMKSLSFALAQPPCVGNVASASCHLQITDFLSNLVLQIVFASREKNQAECDPLRCFNITARAHNISQFWAEPSSDSWGGHLLEVGRAARQKREAGIKNRMRGKEGKEEKWKSRHAETGSEPLRCLSWQSGN